MKTVLFLAYFFPPLGGVGVQRALRFVKHLPSFGWQARVVTVSKGAPYVQDRSLLNDIPEGTQIARTRFLDITLVNRLCARIWPRLAGCLSEVFACFPPDQYVGWLPFAYQRAKKILAQERIDAIYTVSLPYTAHLVGGLLKKQTGKPWLADFRDEWTKNPTRRPRFYLQRRADAWLEQQVLKSADRIIVTTDPYQSEMRSLLPSRMKEKVSVIPNGYEGIDFTNRFQPSRNRHFQIAYVGSLYGPQSPAHFITAVERLLERKLIDPQAFRVQFIGRLSPSLRANGLERLIQAQVVQLVGFVDHRQALQGLLEADALLLIVGSQRGSGNIPAKTFEYLAAGRPILALVPPNGAAADLIRQTRTGLVIPPEDIEAIEKAVLQLYADWRSGAKGLETNRPAVEQYEGKKLTGKLAGLLDEISTLPPPLSCPSV